MKFTLPKVDLSIARKARAYLDQAMAVFNERFIKTEGSALAVVFETLNKFFSTAGSISLRYDMAIKEGNPRPGPSSSHYNRFINATRTDLEGAFDDHASLERAMTLHYNYAQANRLSLEGSLREVNERLTDLSVMTDVDSRDIWYRETFSTDERVDGNASTGRVNKELGVFELGTSNSANVLLPGNIQNLIVLPGWPEATFRYSKPYHGRQYGIIPDLDSSVAPDELPRPDNVAVGDKSLPWTETALFNMVDPAGPDTFWEVELTAREDMSGHNSDLSSRGPCFFLRDSGEHGTVHSNGEGSNSYKYDNGHLVYSSRSYQASKFKNADGSYRKHLFSASITFILSSPVSIDSISITRKVAKPYTVSHNLHAIYVTDIELAGPGGAFESIPVFRNLPGITTKDGTVINRNQIDTPNQQLLDVLTGKLTVSSKVAGREAEVKQRPTSVRTVAGERGDSPTITRVRTASSTSTSVPAVVQPGGSNTMTPSSSKYSTADSWTFSMVEGVKMIRITLATNEPYLVRYSMGRYRVTYNPIVGPKKTNWIFAQYSAEDLTASQLDMDKDIVGKWKLWWPALVRPIILGALHYLFGSTKKDETVHQIHTLDKRDDSDLYRWSIGVAHVAAGSSDYNEDGLMVSTDWLSAQPIDRIMLYTRHDLSDGDISYYIIPEGGQAVRIQPYEERDMRLDNGRYIPKILYVNSPLPADRREKTQWGQAAYIDTEQPLRKFRVQAILTRGSKVKSTPRIDEYRVRVVPKKLGGPIIHVSE